MLLKKKSRPCAGGGVNEPREREQSTALQTVKYSRHVHFHPSRSCLCISRVNDFQLMQREHEQQANFSSLFYHLISISSVHM